MNTATAVSTYIFGGLVAIAVAAVIRRMLRGWRHRAERQADLIGALPEVPDLAGQAVIPPLRGMYLGSTLVPDWLDRVNVGDLGYRCAAVLTRYTEGILLERSGAGPIWMAREAVSAVRTERALAGKVLPGGGILVVRWRLPSGTEIDSGFRGERGSDYTRWTGEVA